MHDVPCDHHLMCSNTLITRDCKINPVAIMRIAQNPANIQRLADKLQVGDFIKYVGHVPVLQSWVDPVGYYNADLISSRGMARTIASHIVEENPEVDWGDDFGDNPSITVELAVKLDIKRAGWNKELRSNIHLLNPKLQAHLLASESTNQTLWAMRNYIRSKN